MSDVHLALGRVGEDAAVAYLEERGYRIIARRWVGAGREIDLIAEIGTVVVFVEVKTRSAGAMVAGVFAVDARKRRQIAAAASAAVARWGLAGREFRFDVISVVTSRAGNAAVVDHIEDAFRL